MTTFLRLIADDEKATGLKSSCTALRRDNVDTRIFEVVPDAFREVPGAPFAYWVSDDVRHAFKRFPAFDGTDRIARVTNPAGNDARFIRAWWEVRPVVQGRQYRWVDFSKGGAFSPYYYDVHLVVQWNDSRQTYHGFTGTEHRPLEKPACLEHFFRPGLTWPRRTQGGLSLRALPKNCIFADKGPAAFVANNEGDALLALLALTNSRAFALLISLQMAFGSYEVGVVQRTPVPDLTREQQSRLAMLARGAWSLKRALDTTEETSHAFILPAALRARLGEYDLPRIEAELGRIQAEVEALVFRIYNFNEVDRLAALGVSSVVTETVDYQEVADGDAESEDSTAPVNQTDGLLSWAVGVVFGRFDARLATAERPAPPEPEPFDPLPAKSPAMLPDDAEPFHKHVGILVDDLGHPHDLPHLVEEVLARVDTTAPEDVRRWLRRDFFAFHLQRYSKSRRKAPIYWPLATTSGSYTLWLYYPSLTSQTLYTAVNDFLEPKLAQLRQKTAELRGKGNTRSREEDRTFEVLQSLDIELSELRDILLRIAPTYRPNHDDGVQITASPLWPLFRHKPWQKLLKETWAKLEKGDYDWSHLAMAYWPERVREKCRTDKSLAIAHDLEHLYEPPEPKAAKPRGRKKADDA